MQGVTSPFQTIYQTDRLIIQHPAKFHQCRSKRDNQSTDTHRRCITQYKNEPGTKSSSIITQYYGNSLKGRYIEHVVIHLLRTALC